VPGTDAVDESVNFDRADDRLIDGTPSLSPTISRVTGEGDATEIERGDCTSGAPDTRDETRTSGSESSGLQ